MKKLIASRVSGPTGLTRQLGFSLIELMIAIVIVAILATVAVSSYVSFTQKAYRTDAKTALLDLASREEKFYTINNQYTSDPTQLYGASGAFPLNVQSGGTAYYYIPVPTVAPSTTTTTATFTVQAVPFAVQAVPAPFTSSSQASDACATFQIDNYGNQTNVNNTITGCW